MSSFNGRREPNVSQFLRELNTLPAAHESISEEFSNDDDLAMFTTTQFFDFDLGHNTDFTPQPVKPETAKPQQMQSQEATSALEEFTAPEFLSGDFGFGDFGTSYVSPTLSNFQEGLNGLQPIQPNPQGLFDSRGNQGAQDARVGDKRKGDASIAHVAPPSRPMSFEEASRLAAEEDKRRRNTAASARFRIKKKQREQALEKSAKEMTEKVTVLENRISQLETENKWLKNLIMEKNSGSSQDMTALWKDFSAKQESARKRAASTAQRAASDTSRASTDKIDDEDLDEEEEEDDDDDNTPPPTKKEK